MYRTLSVALLAATLSTAASADMLDIAKNAVSSDPDCTIENAAQGMALEQSTGIENPCTVEETAKDTLGIDGDTEDLLNQTGAIPGLTGKAAAPVDGETVEDAAEASDTSTDDLMKGAGSLMKGFGN